MNAMTYGLWPDPLFLLGAAHVERETMRLETETMPLEKLDKNGSRFAKMRWGV